MKQKAIYQVIYNDETYEFEHGAQLYIFDYALYWDMDKRGRNVLKSFVYTFFLLALEFHWNNHNNYNAP